MEKTRWEEDWKVTPAGLQIVEARVKGSGAGMEPPEGAVLEDGWWVYAPKLAAQPELALAASGATGDGWTLCAAQACIELGAVAGDAIELSPVLPTPRCRASGDAGGCVAPAVSRRRVSETWRWGRRS